MMIHLDSDLADEYLAESSERLATLESDLIAVENDGAEIDPKRIDRAFRFMHSVKAGAGFFGLQKVRELAHQAEDALAKIRSRQMVPTPDRIGVLLAATDKLRELIHDPVASHQADIAPILTAIAALHAGDRACGKPRQAGSPLRVLLVEDDFACRLLLQTFLSRYGECHIAVNGREAVDAVRTSFEQGQPRYDLICMDIMMPEMDGREAVRQVRDMEEAHGILSTCGARIIMTTAVDDIKEVIRCFRELCDGYLVKPLDLSKLLDQMKSHHLIR